VKCEVLVDKSEVALKMVLWGC